MKRTKLNWKVYLITLVTLVFMICTFAGVALGKNYEKNSKIQDTATFITKDGFNHVADHYVNSSFRIYIFATESNGKQLSNPAINTTGKLTFTGPNNQEQNYSVNIVNNYGSVEISLPVLGNWDAVFVAESGGLKLKHKCEVKIVAESANLSIVPIMPTILTNDLLQFNAIYSDGLNSNPIDVTDSAQWFSNNTIASIDKMTGLATAGSLPGQSQIKADYNGLSVTTTLDVILRTITIDPSATTMSVGSDYQFEEVYSVGYNASTVIWSSSNSNIASVDQTGNVSGIGVGTVTITATDPDTEISGTAEITVTPAPSSVFVVEPKDAFILKGSSQDFVAYYVTPSFKIPIPDFFLKWSSSNSSIATVNAFGSATGLSGGGTNIQASFSSSFLDFTFYILHFFGFDNFDYISDYTSLAKLEVMDPVKIELTQDKTTINVGDQTQFHATLVYNGNQTKDITTDSEITWSSFNTDAVTISNQGLCTGKAAGTSNITAEAYGVSATKPLIVGQPTITINPDSATIRVGSTYKFELVYSAGYSPTIDWSSSNSNIATVDPTGKVSGIGVGSVTITAKDLNSEVRGIATVNVNLPTITIVPGSVTLPVGSTYEFGLTYSAGYSPTILWSSDKPDIATVDPTGKVSGLKVGPVTITAKDQNSEVSGTATVNVNLRTITIDPGDKTIPAGSIFKFTLKFSDEYTPATVIWSSSNNRVEVSPDGTVIGGGSGPPVTITATDPVTGVKGTAQITVRAPVIPPVLPAGWGPNWRMEGPYD